MNLLAHIPCSSDTHHYIGASQLVSSEPIQNMYENHDGDDDGGDIDEDGDVW